MKEITMIILYNNRLNKLGLWFCGMLWTGYGRKCKNSYWHSSAAKSEGWIYIDDL